MKPVTFLFVALWPLSLLHANKESESPERTEQREDSASQLKGLLFSKVDSFDQLQAVLESRWPAEKILTYCKTQTKIKPFVQPPVVLLACNWKGDFPKAKCPEGYEVSWMAIVIGKQIRAYAVSCTNGDDAWWLELKVDETLPWSDQRKLHRLIQDGGDGHIIRRKEEPNQALQRNVYGRHDSCCAGIRAGHSHG